MAGETVIGRLEARFPKQTLEYVKLFATTVLVCVLLPLALLAVLRHPFAVADQAVRSHGIGA